jgi:hypothetical protein
VSGLRALAAWPGPALVALVTAAVAAGAAAAPLLVLTVVVAPLLALLQPTRASERPHPVLLAIVAAVAALVLCAHLIVLSDVAALLGARRWQGSVVAATLALLVTLGPGARWRGTALAAGALGLLVVLAAGASAVHLAPWQAWEQAAARTALVFGARSVWVTEGGAFLRRSTVAFDEGHRVVTLQPGTFRVVEQDGARRVVRDWRLAAGDTMSLRPGDTLTAEAGSRLRFEAGKRVPGAAASGVAWADAGTGTRSLVALGTVLTLALGAVALVPPGDRRAIPAVVAAMALGLGAAGWGVYATLAAPEVGLAGSVAEPLVALARASTLGLRGVPTLMVVLALLALFVAGAGALRQRLGAVGGAPALWTGVVVVAAAAAVAPIDPWLPLLAGLGLAGAALAAPRLAAAPHARIGPWPADVAGGILGAVAFLGATALLVRSAGGFDVSLEPPALAAAVVAWIAVKFLRSEPPTVS